MLSKTAVIVTIVQPVIWAFLGYQFEAASMLCGVASCLAVRSWISLNKTPAQLRTWVIDISVTSISVLFAMGWVILQRPAPFYALLSGAGFGAMGAGIIVFALTWVKKIIPFDDRDDSR